MAEWTGNKVDASSINGGEEYTINDNVSLEELNAIVNNSLYASDNTNIIEPNSDLSATKLMRTLTINNDTYYFPSKSQTWIINEEPTLQEISQISIKGLCYVSSGISIIRNTLDYISVSSTALLFGKYHYVGNKAIYNSYQNNQWTSYYGTMVDHYPTSETLEKIRTIVLYEEPSSTLLQWLQENAILLDKEASSVIINSSNETTDIANSIEVDGVNYALGTSTVNANTGATATDNLETLTIDGITYKSPVFISIEQQIQEVD